MSGILNRIRSSMTARVGSGLNMWKKFVRSLYRDQHQLTSTTEMNRYPELFSSVKELLVNTQPRVLSYGCSTGEECVTLEEYLDPSVLVGADINEENLKIATQRFPSPRLHFILSTVSGLAAHAPYDIVFCLSVLCRWEDTRDVEDCSSIYPFEKFSKAIAQLDSFLAPGGLLVIYNSNFMFEDTETYVRSGYKPVPTPAVPDSGFVHKFDRHNQRTLEHHSNCVYRKAGRS